MPLLGHHSPAFTLATYVHLLPDDLPEPTFLDGLADEGSLAMPAVEAAEEDTALANVVKQTAGGARP